jgi:hypothetical protein
MKNVELPPELADTVRFFRAELAAAREEEVARRARLWRSSNMIWKSSSLCTGGSSNSSRACGSWTHRRRRYSMQETDRCRRAAYFLGRLHARRQHTRERQREIEDQIALADLQDQIAEAEAVELTGEDER